MLEGVYSTPEPGAVIDLYSGELALSWDGGTVVGDGTITLDWSPSPRIAFQFTIRPGYEQVPPPSESNDSARLLSPEGGKGDVLRFGQVFNDAPNRRIIAGEIDGCFEVGNPAPVESILFHVPNFPDSVGVAVNHNGGTSATRMEIETSEWLINLDDIAGSDLRRQLAERSGFAITHVGDIRRCDGEAIQYSLVDDLLTSVLWWLSTLRSERTGPALISGLHEGRTVWERWEIGLVSPWLGRRTWLPRLPPNGGWPVGPNPTSSIFQFLCEQPKVPGIVNSVEQVIDWYTQSVTSSHIATKGVLAQAGNELLSWMRLVEDVGVTTDGFARMTAADQLRMALSYNKSSMDVPASLPNLFRVTRNGGDGQELDGPGAITEIRNSVVHPKRNARFNDPMAMLEGSFLAIRYLELLLLHRCGYVGRMFNRTAWSEGEVMVPWAAQDI